MREMYIEEITKNLNVLSEHFLRCVWILQVTLHPTRKAVRDERTADNGNPEHTGREVFTVYFEHDTFI